MKHSLRRSALGARYGLNQHFQGLAVLTPSGASVRFRGVDVSSHGLGCVVFGAVNMRDVLRIDIYGHHFHFEVMWVESYLGIEDTYRIGLQCLDRFADIRSRLSVLGFVTAAIEEEFVA
jgi:hypothetical protein